MIFAGLVDPAPRRHAIELVQRQGDEQLDPRFKREVRPAKGIAPLGLRADHSGGVGHTPTGGDRIARPEGANTRRLIADGEDEIHDRCVGPREFVPTLGAQTVGRQMQPFEAFERQRVNPATGKAACAIALEAAEAALSPMIDQRLGEDVVRRIVGTQEQDVIRFALHGGSANAARGRATRRLVQWGFLASMIAETM